jgi:hypothetical protein
MSIKLPEDDELLLDDTETVQVLGYRNVRTLKRHRDEGKAPPSLLIGRKRYTRVGSLRSHLRKQETGAGTERRA